MTFKPPARRKLYSNRRTNRKAHTASIDQTKSSHYKHVKNKASKTHAASKPTTLQILAPRACLEHANKAPNAEVLHHSIM